MKNTIYTIGFLILLCLSHRANAQKLAWAKQMRGDSLNSAGFSIVLDASGNVYTTGDFEGTVDFDPGPSTYYLTSAGSEDIYISKSDPAGNFIWAKKMGGTLVDQGHSIKVDPWGNVYITGRFMGTVDFDPGPAIYNLSATGTGILNSDNFISKLDASGNFAWAAKLGGIKYNEDINTSLAIDGSGNVYATGYFVGTADFDPGRVLLL